MSDTQVRTQKATQILQEDHRKVRKLFSDYENLGDEDFALKHEIFEAVRKELAVHTVVEEEIFYPSIEEGGDEKAREWVAEARQEHDLVKTMLDELSALDTEDEEFDAKMKVLIEDVRQHADDEEEEIFPRFDELPKVKQSEISEELRRRKIELGESVE